MMDIQVSRANLNIEEKDGFEEEQASQPDGQNEEGADATITDEKSKQGPSIMASKGSSGNAGSRDVSDKQGTAIGQSRLVGRKKRKGARKKNKDSSQAYQQLTNFFLNSCGSSTPSNVLNILNLIQEKAPAFQRLFLANLLKDVSSLAAESVVKALAQNSQGCFAAQQPGKFQGSNNSNDPSMGMLQNQMQKLVSNGPLGFAQLQDILTRMLGPHSTGFPFQGPGGLPANNNLGPKGLLASNYLEPRGLLGNNDLGPRGFLGNNDLGPRGLLGNNNLGPRGLLGNNGLVPRGLLCNNDLRPRGLLGNNKNLGPFNNNQGPRRLPVPELIGRECRKRHSSNSDATNKQGQPTPSSKSKSDGGKSAKDQNSTSGERAEKWAKLESFVQENKTILSNSRRERVTGMYGKSHKQEQRERDRELERQRLATGRNKTLVDITGKGSGPQNQPKPRDSSSAFKSTSYKNPASSSARHSNHLPAAFDSHYHPSLQGMRMEPATRWPTPSYDYFNFPQPQNTNFQQYPPLSQASGVPPPSYHQTSIPSVSFQYYGASSAPASNSYIGDPSFYPQQQQQQLNPSSSFYYPPPDFGYTLSFSPPPQIPNYPPPMPDRSAEMHPSPYAVSASDDYDLDCDRNERRRNSPEQDRHRRKRSRSRRDTQSERVTVYNVSKQATSDTLLKICSNYGRVLDIEFVKENGEDRAIIQFEPGD